MRSSLPCHLTPSLNATGNVYGKLPLPAWSWIERPGTMSPVRAEEVLDGEYFPAVFISVAVSFPATERPWRAEA